MKKRNRKLSLSKETVKTLSAPALEQAVGGKIRAFMTGDPTECICPAPRLRAFRVGRIQEIRIRD